MCIIIYLLVLSPRVGKKDNPFLSALSQASTSHDPRLTAEPLPSNTNKSLHLKGVPDECNNESYLTDHYNKYGQQVESVSCNPNKKCANIHFKTKVIIIIISSLCL